MSKTGKDDYYNLSPSITSYDVAASRESETWLTGQTEAFRAALDGVPLSVSLNILAQTSIAHQGSNVKCAFYMVDDSLDLQYIAGTILSNSNCIDCFKIGPDSLASGLAVYTSMPIITSDVTKDPKWQPFIWFAIENNFRAIWSFPVETSSGIVVGSYSMYFAEPLVPTARDYEVATALTRSAAIIISRHQETEERSKAETALRNSEARLRNALAIQTVGVAFWNDAFCLSDANTAFLDMIGRTREEALGISWQEITPNEYHAVSLKAINELKMYGEATPYEKQIICSGHFLKWGLFTARNVGDLIVEFALDITERKTGEKYRDQLLSILGQSQTVVCDWTGKILVWSQGMERLFGYTPSEALGVNLRSLMKTEDSDSWDAVVTALRCENSWQGEVRYQAKDGFIRVVHEIWNLHPGFDSVEDSLVAAVEDQTAVKSAEERLIEMNKTLENRVFERTNALIEAESTLRQMQKLDAVGQLASGIAHDFNNMLQSISGNLEFIRRRIDQGRMEDAIRYVDNADTAVKRAAILSGRLLTFARQQKLDEVPTDLDELLVGLRELIKSTDCSINLNMVLNGKNWKVSCDPNQMENAVLNICINARDAMPNGGTITIKSEGIELTKKDVLGEADVKPGEYVNVSISDTGTGMSPEVVSHIFEPFYTTKPRGKGTGLGLAQVYGFIRQSGGFVRVKSAIGQGTTVNLYLPHYVPEEATE